MIENKGTREKTQIYISEYNKILENMITEMTEVKFTDSISHNFIKQMIPHHRAAIEMSENVLKYTSNVKLQDIAYNIINMQTKSIKSMDMILNCCGTIINSEKELKSYEEKNIIILENMFCRMKNAEVTSNVSCDFMREMMPHHMGAIEMSKNTMKYPIREGLKPILNNIITSQRKGIHQMRNLMKCLKCKQ